LKMKGRDIIKYATSDEMPDKEKMRESVIRKAEETEEKRPFKRGLYVKQFAAAAACLVLVLAVTLAIPFLRGKNIKTPGADTSGSGADGGNKPVDTSLIGLPCENFSLADTQSGGAMFDREVFYDFETMLQFGTEYFAVVRIIDTRTEDSRYKSGFDYQISEAYVIENIYNDCGVDRIQITQSIIENHFCLGTTNLLREGGLYLLPLKHEYNRWFIVGVMDVLFEVDDKGIVWSHSGFETFNRYDGMSVESLISELKELFADEDYMLANSSFGSALRSITLADVTIVDRSDKIKDDYGFECYKYSYTVVEVLSYPEYGVSSIKEKETGKFKVYADMIDEYSFVLGERYLLFLSEYEREVCVNSFMSAKIKDDKIVTPKAEGNKKDFTNNIFEPYDGYKLSELRDIIARIKAWQAENK
jgi:hypothetical protein